MSTVIEERLAAALRARVELVQPEDLRHKTLSSPAPTPIWRRPVAVALVAAAAVVAIVVPLVLRSHHTTDSPLPPTNGIPKPVPSLAGDMDGDGRPDRLTASGTTLTVVLAADPAHPHRATVSHLAGLVGTVDTGGHGDGIVVATGGTGVKGGVNWEVYILGGGDVLRGVPVSAGTGQPDTTNLSDQLRVLPGIAVSWITPQGVLMSGGVDPSQHGEHRLAVTVSRFVGRGDGLTQVPVGRWCWDKATQPLPAPCPSGVTDAYDPGPHGALPGLLPKLAPDFMLPGDTWHDGSTVLHLVKGTPHTASFIKQTYDVVGTVDGHEVSAQAGYATPRVYQTFVDLGHGVRGIVAVDDSKATWNLLAVTSRGLLPVVAPDPSHGANGTLYLHPGVEGLVDAGTSRESDTWIGADGQVFTRVATEQPGRYRTYEWQVTDSSGTKLKAVDLGTVCIDDFWGTYGTCSS